MLKKFRDKYRKRKFKKSVKIVGSDLKIYGENIKISYPENIIIGDGLKINAGVVINARGGVEIGNRVTLSDNCKIFSCGYDLEKWRQNNERVHKNGKVVIGDDVWICANAIICPGVIISAHHVVIAAGAVVTKNIDDSYCIVTGVPAQIKKRF